LQSETDTNTLTNELSPVSAYAPNTRLDTCENRYVYLLIRF